MIPGHRIRGGKIGESKKYVNNSRFFSWKCCITAWNKKKKKMKTNGIDIESEQMWAICLRQSEWSLETVWRWLQLRAVGGDEWMVLTKLVHLLSLIHSPSARSVGANIWSNGQISQNKWEMSWKFRYRYDNMQPFGKYYRKMFFFFPSRIILNVTRKSSTNFLITARYRRSFFT